MTSKSGCCPGYFAANSAAIDSSVGVWLGSSPPPRQQNQRRSAASNSGTWKVCAGAAVGPWVAGGPAVATPPCEGVVVAVGPPHAPTTMTIAANSARTRGGLVSTSSSFSTQPATIAGSGIRVSAGAGPDDDAFDVVAGAVAADVRPPELDRDPVGGEGRALDEEGEAPGPQPEQACLACREEDRLEDLPRPGHGRSVALGQEGVQRAVLQVRGEQAREALGRQVDHLEEQRVAAGEPQPLDVQGGATTNNESIR